MGYLTGLVEGFSGRRDKVIEDEQRLDAGRRAQEAKIFEYLLQSRDPDMTALAMSGLFETAQPGKRGKGLRGYLGDIQSGSIYPLVRARMEEMIPDTSGSAPAPPATPGSAAMSTNAPVEAGSAPIQLPGRPLPMEGPPPPPVTDTSSGVMAPMLDVPLEAQASDAIALPPPGPPPPSKWKRRGTGVPTAEEIAEMNARIPLETRIGMARANLPEDAAQQAVMGILGAPQTTRQFTAPGTFGVKVPDGQGGEHVVPVSFDVTKGKYFLPDGVTPVPNTAEMVRMTGSSGGAAKRNIVPDTTSPTGYSAVYIDPVDGTELYRTATVYTPPPAFAGTGTILDTGGNATLVGVPRGGGPPVPIGTAPNPQPSEGQSAAQALLADVQARIAAQETPRLPGMPRRPLIPAQRDQIVREAATAAGLPYTTYFELEQATRLPTARQAPPRANAPAAPAGASAPPIGIADRVRQRALEHEGAMGAPPPPPPPPTGRPSARAGGPGPR